MQDKTDTKVAVPRLCPLCNLGTRIVHLESHVDGSTRYELYECIDCAARFWEPMKNPGAHWYEHDPRYAGANANPPREPNWNHRKTVSYMSGKKGKVFDMGCGTGNFLSWARENGWDVYGIDFDGNAVATAKGIFGLPHIEQSGLSEALEHHPEYKGSFNLVTFFDVFEHIDNHAEFARQIASLVHSDGYIAMSMPCREGARWLQHNDLPPRHLTRWDERSLVTFWERHGFKSVYVYSMPTPFEVLLMKFRFKYGMRFSLGLVDRVKKTQARENNESGSANPKMRSPLRVRTAYFLARAKDIVLFGIPAGITWIVMRPTRASRTNLYAIFQKA